MSKATILYVFASSPVNGQVFVRAKTRDGRYLQHPQVFPVKDEPKAETLVQKILASGEIDASLWQPWT